MKDQEYARRRQANGQQTEKRSEDAKKINSRTAGRIGGLMEQKPVIEVVPFQPNPLGIDPRQSVPVRRVENPVSIDYEKQQEDGKKEGGGPDPFQWETTHKIF
jgi:hypothetical protein